MGRFDNILQGRKTLATLCGILTHSSDGTPVEQAPCNMPLGDAILQLAAADSKGIDTRSALVVWRGGILDRTTCLDIASQFGQRLAAEGVKNRLENDAD